MDPRRNDPLVTGTGTTARTTTVETTSVGETPAEIFLQPIAAPSILGLFGLAAALFVIATQWAGWYGHDATSPYYLFPFVAMVGGIAQFMAGMWAYRARDGVATALHGVWGGFFLAYGIVYFLAAIGTVAVPSGAFVEMGYWFIALAAITWAIAAAAMAENLPLAVVVTILAIGASVMAVSQLINSGILMDIAGWVLAFDAIVAWYTASALMIDQAFGRQMLPMIKMGPAKKESRVAFGFGEPGVVHGQ
jgi:succinate-acetate transporter protein